MTTFISYNIVSLILDNANRTVTDEGIYNFKILFVHERKRKGLIHECKLKNF